ncbi:PP2C family protein-serine/threonine phosphatase [Streptomyces hydrogenans]|uniref:PP2C family protein-serine/threonine phosphatase n=1 Tax=Streptomyces hydrogenans TaxID=1873719 RepID=UPI0035D966EC
MGAVAILLCLLFAWKADRFSELRMTVALAAIAYHTLEDDLFVPVPPTIGPVRIGASYVSSSRATRVGGDLYDAEPCPAGVRLVIADVQGKGLESVRHASVVITAFRAAAPEAGELADVDRGIETALERRTDGQRFVTGVLAQISRDGSLLAYNHGHPPPLLLPCDDEAVFVETDHQLPPFGLAALTGITGPGDSGIRLALRVGDGLFFYTDGLSEARDADGLFHPACERVAPLLRDGRPEDVLARIRAGVAAFTGKPPDDDSALLLIEFRGPPPADARQRASD